MSNLLLLFLCLYFLLGSTKTSQVQVRNNSQLEVHDEYLQTRKVLSEQNISLVGNHFAEVSEQLAGILKNRNLLTQISLANGCGNKVQERLQTEIELAIKNFKHCNVMNIFVNLVIVAVDTIKFLAEVSVDSALIVAEVVACTGSFNPWLIMKCIFRAATVFPEQVRELIDTVEDYRDVVEYFVPKIFIGMESCFNNTVNNYDILKDDILNNPQMCKK